MNKDEKEQRRNQEEIFDHQLEHEKSFMELFAEEVVPVAKSFGGGGTITEDEEVQRDLDKRD